MSVRKIGQVSKSYDSQWVNAFEAFVMSDYKKSDKTSLGETVVTLDRAAETNTIEGNRTDFMYENNMNKVQGTLTSKFPDLDALNIMLKGRAIIWQYDGSSTIDTFTIRPGNWTTDASCKENAYRICHPFCDEPTVNVMSVLGCGPVDTLQDGTDYVVEQAADGSTRCVRFINTSLDIKATITIEVSGVVEDGCYSIKYAEDCTEMKPVVLELTAPGSCELDKEVSLFIDDAVFETPSWTLPVQGTERGEFTFNFMGYISNITGGTFN